MKYTVTFSLQTHRITIKLHSINKNPHMHKSTEKVRNEGQELSAIYVFVLDIYIETPMSTAPPSVYAESTVSFFKLLRQSIGTLICMETILAIGEDLLSFYILRRYGVSPALTSKWMASI